MTRNLVRRAIAALVSTIAVASVIVAAPPAAATFGGQQGPIYFRVAGPDGIHRINPDGSNRQAIVPREFTLGGCSNCTYSVPENPAISPDGRTLLFDVQERSTFNGQVSYGGAWVAKMTVDPPGPITLVTPGEMPSWSPDGASFVFSRVRGSDATWSRDLWIRDGAGVDRQLTRSIPGYHALDPDWSPNGRFIVFAFMNQSAGYIDGGSDVRLWRADGYGTPQVLSVVPNDSDPSPTWRPDSARVAYSTGSGIYVSPVSTTGVPGTRFRLFGSTPSDRYPAYAPTNDAATDGDTVVVTRSLDQYYFLRSTDIRGSQRGPIAGGRGTSWAQVRPVVSVRPGLLPTPEPTPDVNALVRQILDDLVPACRPIEQCTTPGNPPVTIVGEVPAIPLP